MLLMSSLSYTQWKYQRIAKRELNFDLISVKSRGLALKLKVLETSTIMYLQGYYFAEINPFITFDLYTTEGVKSHSFKGIDGYYDDIVILTYDLKNSKVYSDLKNTYSLKVTIYDTIINNSSIKFNIGNTREIFDFIK